MDPIRLISIIGIAASAIVVLAGLGLFIMVNTGGGQKLLERTFDANEPEPVIFANLKRSEKPNDYLVCPEAYCAQAEPDAEPPVINLPADQMRDRLIDLVENVPQKDDVQRLRFDLAQGHYEFLARTATMRFPDHVAVDIIPLSATESTLALYSRSLYGYSDVGKNRERLEIWLRFLVPDGADITLPKRKD